MGRVIGYSRVSTREQSENSRALEQQQARLTQAGAEEIFTDVESGRRDDRASFNSMMELIRKGSIKEIIITRLDRLTRSLPTLRKTIEEIQKYRVNLRALDDAIDLSTAAGKFHLNILGSLAEMESDRLSERVKHGWQHVRNQEIPVNVPFGYCKLDNKLQLDTTPFLCLIEERSVLTSANIARDIVEAFLEKQTIRLALRVINQKYGISVFAHNRRVGGRVAARMFRFSPAGLRDWLTNPVLQGHLCYLRKKDLKRLPKEAWDIRHDTHPEHRLITDLEARRIEEILKQNRLIRGYGTSALKYPLSGLIYCGECRSACYSLKGSRGKNQPGYNYYFQCKNWRVRACKNKQMVRMEVAEQHVIAHLIQRAQAIAEYASIPPEQIESPQLQQLRSQLAGLEQLGQNPAIEAAKNDVRQQIKAELAKSQQQEVIDVATQELLLKTFTDPEYWQQLSDADKRQIYRDLVGRVIVRDGQVEKVELRV